MVRITTIPTMVELTDTTDPSFMWQGITILMGKDGMSMVGREEIDGKERPYMAFDSMS